MSATATKTTMKIEVVFVTVTDVDRARDFYRDKLGWSVDHDQAVNDELRFVQMTPPGSACSVAFGKGLTENKPGSLNNVMLVVEDTPALHAQLKEEGVTVSDIDVQQWGTFVTVTDPDGNTLTFQQLPDYGS